MRKLALPFFLMLMLISCSEKEKMPPDIFPLNKMKEMVWDMEIAEQTAAEKFLQQKDSLRMETTSLYGQVLAKHKTGKKAFYKSMCYYESHPTLLKILFDSVSSYGNRQKGEAYKKAY